MGEIETQAAWPLAGEVVRLTSQGMGNLVVGQLPVPPLQLLRVPVFVDVIERKSLSFGILPGPESLRSVGEYQIIADADSHADTASRPGSGAVGRAGAGGQGDNYGD